MDYLLPYYNTCLHSLKCLYYHYTSSSSPPCPQFRNSLPMPVLGPALSELLEGSVAVLVWVGWGVVGGLVWLISDHDIKQPVVSKSCLVL